MTRSFLIIAGLTAGLISSLSFAAPAEAPLPIALAAMQPGQWQLRSLDGSAPPKTLCIGDPRVLLQIRHGAAPCTKLVLLNQATQAIVSYSCAAAGSGRTTVRVETPRVAQIESQGIADQAPFDWTYEARRVGECPASAQTAFR